MTKSKARKWLGAIRSLAAYYRRENNYYLNKCSLCLIAGKKAGANWDCQKCLWYIFNKQARKDRPCCAYSSRLFLSGGAGFFRSIRDHRWSKLSLKRLARWEKRLLVIRDEGVVNK